MISAQHQRWAEDAETDRLIEKEIEAEICQRFIRLSCEKMLNARHERGGAKLHRNLLILHLLRKARSDSTRLPYECANLLLNRPPMSTTSAVTRHLSAGAVSPPQEHVFLSEAEVETHEEEEEEKTADDDDGQQQFVVQEVVLQDAHVEDDEDEEVDVVSCDDEPQKPMVEPPNGTLRSVPSTYSLLDISAKDQAKQTKQHLVTVGGPLEYKVRDQDESEKYKRSSFRGNSLLIGHMSLDSRFEPLHLPFTSGDAIEEATDVASLLDESEHSKVPELSDDLDQQLQMISPPISPPEARKLDVADSKFFGVVAPLDFEDDDQPPQLFSCQESDDEDSGTEDDCEDEDESDGQKQKRRKRKTSTPRTQTVAEKRQCTVDADSDSGVDVDAECVVEQPQQPKKSPATLISVYSTGLGTTIVPQSTASLADQQVPVLKRIHSYPLFCK